MRTQETKKPENYKIFGFFLFKIVYMNAINKHFYRQINTCKKVIKS